MQDLSRLTRLRLGMIEDFDAEVTPRLLSLMAEDLKTCHFLLETGASHGLAEKLASHALDVIVAADLGQGADWMEVHPLLVEPFVVAAPRGMVAPGADLRAQLLEAPFIHYTSQHMMGRMIEAHLLRHRITLPHRFELDSYHAIMAMVAAGAGWTIITPLGFMAAHRFRDAAEMHRLPTAPLARTIALFARRGILGTMPEDIAARMRPLLRDLAVGPATDRVPWLIEDFRVLGPQVP
jgi:DNA-binding transcriptional LysR family regulator